MTRGEVLLVIRHLLGRKGGAERLLCDIANLLDDAGFSVTVAHSDRRRAPVPYRLAEGVTVRNLWRPVAQRGRLHHLAARIAGGESAGGVPGLGRWVRQHGTFLAQVRRLMRETRPEAVVSFLPPANTPTLIAGWREGVRVVPTNHSVPEHDYGPLRWDPSPVDRWLRRRVLARADRIHVLMPGFVEWFPARLRDRVVVLPNAVSPEFLTPAEATPRQSRVVAVGRLVEVKNLPVLLDAWSRVVTDHPGWRLEIHGTGPEEEALAARIEALGLGDTCRLVGHTDDMRRVLADSEVLAHPALFEGFGLSVAEALAQGCPVVAFADCTGVNEIVRHEVNGLLVDRDEGAEGLARAIGRLLEDGDLRERLREAGPGSLECFSPERFTRSWIELVDGVVARSRADRS